MTKIVKVVLSAFCVVCLVSIVWMVVNVIFDTNGAETIGIADKNIMPSVDIAIDTSKTASEAVHQDDKPALEEKPAAPDEQEEVDEEDEISEEEKKEAEEERLLEEFDRLVEEFDQLTDKWMEPSKKPITIDEINKFTSSFRKVPKARRDECIQRALNLVPDENVMVLAGILLDKSFGNETVETVFNDILNRDESVKKPILEQIFKDKTHPCWADVAWILDVTGELPTAK